MLIKFSVAYSRSQPNIIAMVCLKLVVTEAVVMGCPSVLQAMLGILQDLN
jgi:hypothetical protein